MRTALLVACLSACSTYGKITGTLGTSFVVGGLALHETTDRQNGYTQPIAGLSMALGGLYLFATVIAELQHAAGEDPKPEQVAPSGRGAGGGDLGPSPPTSAFPIGVPAAATSAITCMYDPSTGVYRQCGGVDPTTYQCAGWVGPTCTP